MLNPVDVMAKLDSVVFAFLRPQLRNMPSSGFSAYPNLNIHTGDLCKEHWS